MRRHNKITGIVIRRTNLAEADKFVTIFTKDAGKVTLVAKGIRRLASRRAAHLELGNEVEVATYQGAKSPYIVEARLINNFSNIKEDLLLSANFFYLAEVLDKLLPDSVPHQNAYAFLKTCLEDLKNTSSKDTVKHFVSSLLWDLGYLPKGVYPKTGLTAFVESVTESTIKSKKFLDEL